MENHGFPWFSPVILFSFNPYVIQFHLLRCTFEDAFCTSENPMPVLNMVSSNGSWIHKTDQF